MSTKELAYHIIDSMNEAELNGLVMMFIDKYPFNTGVHSPSPDKQERDKAWSDFKKMCISRPDFDEKKAKDEYFREKFGV